MSGGGGAGAGEDRRVGTREIEDGRAKGDERARYGSDPPAPHQKLVMAKGQESKSL